MFSVVLPRHIAMRLEINYFSKLWDQIFLKRTKVTLITLLSIEQQTGINVDANSNPFNNYYRIVIH